MGRLSVQVPLEKDRFCKCTHRRPNFIIRSNRPSTNARSWITPDQSFSAVPSPHTQNAVSCSKPSLQTAGFEQWCPSWVQSTRPSDCARMCAVWASLGCVCKIAWTPACLPVWQKFPAPGFDPGEPAPNETLIARFAVVIVGTVWKVQTLIKLTFHVIQDGKCIAGGLISEMIDCRQSHGDSFLAMAHTTAESSCQYAGN